MVKIRHKTTGEVLFEDDSEDLRGADLSFAYIRDADFHGAYLRDADFHGAIR